MNQAECCITSIQNVGINYTGAVVIPVCFWRESNHINSKIAKDNIQN